jgi:hypothetical protein
MAVRKLSEITDATANLSSADFMVAVTGSTTDVLFSAAQVFGYLNLYLDFPNAFAERNGTTPQGQFIYGTYTDPSNYERLFIGQDSSDANRYKFLAEKAGTGATRGMKIDVLNVGGDLGLMGQNVGLTIGSNAQFSVTDGFGARQTFLAERNNTIVNAVGGTIGATAIDGYLYISVSTATPTGTPRNYGANVPLIYDDNANRLYIFDVTSTTWRWITTSSS